MKHNIKITPLIEQMEKLFRHTRTGSFKTRARYKSSCRNFLDFVHKEFKLKNIKNLQDKHVVAYIKKRQEEGVSPKTIKNDLVAIRYLHDMIPNAKYQLSDNDDLKKLYELKLDKTPAVKGDRGWTDEEYRNILSFVNEKASENKTAADTRDVMILCRTMGLRVAEAVAMKRSQAEEALRTGIYQVRGEAKNGKWRQVPLSNEARQMLLNRLKIVNRGEKVFVGPNEKTHHAINRVEKFLENHREKFVTEEGKQKRMYKGKSSPLTFHGLRYNYVQDRIKEEMEKGYSFEQAASFVTKEVGHERIDVIKVYLGNKNVLLIMD